jgi:hypothetical protein
VITRACELTDSPTLVFSGLSPASTINSLVCGRRWIRVPQRSNRRGRRYPLGAVVAAAPCWFPEAIRALRGRQRHEGRPEIDPFDLSFQPPLCWIVLNRTVSGEWAHSFRLRVWEILHDVRVEVVQDERVLASRRPPSNAGALRAAPRQGCGKGRRRDRPYTCPAGSARLRAQRRAERANQETGDE